MKYTPTQIKFKYYGKNMELLVEQVTQVADPKIREAQVIHVGRLMKSLYAQWNHETLSTEGVIEHIKTLSGGKMDCDMEKIKEGGLLDIPIRESSSKDNERRPHPNGGRENRERRNGGRENRERSYGGRENRERSYGGRENRERRNGSPRRKRSQ